MATLLSLNGTILAINHPFSDLHINTLQRKTMFKLLFGFLMGCFVTYNYIIPNEDYKLMLDHANTLALELIESIEEQLRKNVENK